MQNHFYCFVHTDDVLAEFLLFLSFRRIIGLQEGAHSASPSINTQTASGGPLGHAMQSERVSIFARGSMPSSGDDVTIVWLCA